MPNYFTAHPRFLTSRPVYILCVLIAAGLVTLALDHWRLRTPVSATTARGPVRVRGLVMAAGSPQGGVFVRLVATEGRSGGQAKTDSNGRFQTSVSRPGTYLAMVSVNKALPSTSQEVLLKVGDNRVTVDLPPTDVRIKIISADGPPPEIVQIVLHGPADDTGDSRGGFVTRGEGLQGRFVGMGFGHYRVSAFATQGVAASSMVPGTFTLSTTAPSADVTLRLVRRALAVQVVDENGEPIDYAEIFALHRRLERSEGGAFDASWMPGGEEMVVRAAGMLSVCRYPGPEANQVVRLEPLKAAQARITLLDAPSTIGGKLTGLPGSDCPVPVASLDVDWATSENNSLRMAIRGLPAGEYGYQAAERAPLAKVRAPGDELVYRVPPSCRMCG